MAGLAPNEFPNKLVVLVFVPNPPKPPVVPPKPPNPEVVVLVPKPVEPNSDGADDVAVLNNPPPVPNPV